MSASVVIMTVSVTLINKTHRLTGTQRERERKRERKRKREREGMSG